MNKKVRLQHLVDRRTPGGLFMWLNFWALIRLRHWFGRERDGWRKTTESNHRQEGARYLGSLGGLHLYTGSFRKVLLSGLYPSLKKASYTRQALRWTRQAAQLIPWQPVDFCEVEFDGNGKIDRLDFFPDPEYPMPALWNSEDKISQLLQQAFNETLHKMERRRPLHLKKVFMQRTRQHGMHDEACREVFFRLTRASWLHFTTFVHDHERLIPWCLHHISNAGGGLLDFEVRSRPLSSSFDLWVKVSHIGIDGRFGNKFMKRLKRAFPKLADAPAGLPAKQPFFQRSNPGLSAFHGGGFLNFRRILDFHEKCKQQGISTSLITIIAWKIGAHPFFREKKINIPVNVPAGKGKAPSLGFIFIRPSRLRKIGVDFAAFNTLMRFQAEGILQRKGAGYELVQSAAILPAWLNNFINHSCLHRPLQEVTGQMSCTLFRDVEIIYPTLSDNILAGFAFSLPMDCEEGFVGIRSSRDDVSSIYSALKQALE